MSYRDDLGFWTVPFNVTNLSAQEYGYRPKVTATTTEAHVAFIAPSDTRLWSRDLDLQSSAWENSYSYVSTNLLLSVYSTNVVTIGDTVYALFAMEPTFADHHDYQSFYFTQRHKNDATWRTPAYVTAATYGLRTNYMRNRMVAQNNSLYFLINCNHNFVQPPIEQLCDLSVLQLWSYPTASVFNVENLFNGQSTTESTSGASLLLSGWQNGVYAYWDGDPNGYNMRRKPFAITGTIAERTLLTGNNWVSGQAATVAYNFTVDALSNSITTVLDDSWLNINGTLNANSSSQFKFGGVPYY